MERIELSAGPIHYHDEGSGPIVVFIHGLLVNSTLWRDVTARMTGRFRCIRPDWPLGAHTEPMHPHAVLTPTRVAALIGEFLDALDLHEVTLVANDTGGAVTQLLLANGCDRVHRVVLTPCDSFDNFLPPAFRPLQYFAKVPGALTTAMQPMRMRAARRAVIGLLAKHPVPDEVIDASLRPYLTNPGIRRDTIKFLRTIDAADTQRAADQLRGYPHPVLLLWTPHNRFFPLAHAHRWLDILADAHLVEIHDAYTFVPADQPERVAHEIGAFLTATAR